MDEYSTSGPRWRASGVWREYLQFLRSPRLPDTMVPFGPEARAEVGRLLLLDLSLCALLVCSFVAFEAAGLKIPDNDVNFGNPRIALLAILFAPPIEELIFRSWLPGKRLMLLAAAGLAALIAVLNLLPTFVPLGKPTVIALAFACVAVPTVEIILSWKDRGSVPGLYRSGFPVVYWLSCIAFASAHLSNYHGSLHPFMLFLVAPQLVTGTILAFARLRYGMWANISLHAAHNAALVLLAAAFG